MVKEELVNTFKVGSIEEDVQQNQEDIIDLRYIMDATQYWTGVAGPVPAE